MVLLLVQTKLQILTSHFSFPLGPEGMKQTILESLSLAETIHIKILISYGVFNSMR